MFEFAQEFRVSAQGLRIGMFVPRLDRAWLGTQFPLQGFLISTEEELRALQALCSHAYVDVSRGSSPETRYIELEGPSSLVEDAKGHDEFVALRKTEWTTTTTFDTELTDAQAAHESLQAGISEVMEDLRAGRDLDLQKLGKGVDAMIDSITRNPTAFSWLKEIKRKDDYTYQHALSCAVWAASFGRHLGLEREELRELSLAGLLFDVGKTRLSSALLTKHAALDAHERAQMERHVAHGLEILESTPGIPPALLEMVAHHHERHDGSGYPQGLVGSAIPIGARILGMVDTYDALTTQRAHAPGLAPHQAVAELYRNRGTLFQAELVEQFIQTCGIYPTGSLVELSNGQVGVVTAVHSLKRLRPSVMLLLDAGHRPLADFRTIHLGDVADPGTGEVLAIRRGLAPGAYGINPAELFLD